MAFFHRYHCWWLSFPSKLSISLLPTSVTTRSDCCYHQQFNSKPSYFHHLVVGRVEAVHEEASPNYNAKRTAIHHRFLIPRGRLVRGVVPKFSDIYTPPPQTPPRSGDAKQILSLTGDAAVFGARTHAWVIPDWELVVVGLPLEGVRCNMQIVNPQGKQQSILHAEHPRHVPPPQKYG